MRFKHEDRTNILTTRSFLPPTHFPPPAWHGSRRWEWSNRSGCQPYAAVPMTPGGRASPCPPLPSLLPSLEDSASLERERENVSTVCLFLYVIANQCTPPADEHCPCRSCCLGLNLSSWRHSWQLWGQTKILLGSDNQIRAMQLLETRGALSDKHSQGQSGFCQPFNSMGLHCLLDISWTKQHAFAFSSMIG